MTQGPTGTSRRALFAFIRIGTFPGESCSCKGCPRSALIRVTAYSRPEPRYFCEDHHAEARQLHEVWHRLADSPGVPAAPLARPERAEPRPAQGQWSEPGPTEHRHLRVGPSLLPEHPPKLDSLPLTKAADW